MTEPVLAPSLRRNRWARISRISSKSADASGCVPIFRSEIKAWRYSKDRQGWGDAKGLGTDRGRTLGTDRSFSDPAAYDEGPHHTC